MTSAFRQIDLSTVNSHGYFERDNYHYPNWQAKPEPDGWRIVAKKHRKKTKNVPYKDRPPVHTNKYGEKLTGSNVKTVAGIPLATHLMREGSFRISRECNNCHNPSFRTYTSLREYENDHDHRGRHLCNKCRRIFNYSTIASVASNYKSHRSRANEIDIMEQLADEMDAAAHENMEDYEQIDYEHIDDWAAEVSDEYENFD